jgi:hypothetical protein
LGINAALYPWEMNDKPPNYWEDSQNRRNYFNWLGNLLGIKKPSDWYSITSDQIIQNGGKELLEYYSHHSHYSILAFTYPQYDWHPWILGNLTQDFWNDSIQVQIYFEWLVDVLKVLIYYIGLHIMVFTII